jgi:PKD repeat protein
MKKFYFFALLSVTFFGINAQCMLFPLSIDSRINNSSLIIEGSVLSKKSFWNTDHNYIYTSNLVSVTQVLKGSLNTSFVEVITDGGQVDDMKQEVEPALSLSANEKGIFMLNTKNIPSQYGFTVYESFGDVQGFIKFMSDGSAVEPFKVYSSANIELRNLLSAKLLSSINVFGVDAQVSSKYGAVQINMMPVTSFAPSSITAGTASQLTITGSGFGAAQGTNVVQFKNADDGGATNITPHISQYVSWNNTQIVVQVPSKTGASGQAGSGTFSVVIAGVANVSPSSLTVTYGHLNVYNSNTLTVQQIFNTRHHNLNGSGGMTWRMHNLFDANLAQKNDFQTAFTTWRCNTYINWQIGPTCTTPTIALDGTNVIGMDNQVGPQLPGGVLGRCTSYWGGCFSGGVWSWHVVELDIAFDDATNWQYGAGALTITQYDFESVVLHELGHGHQLSHVIDNLGVMHWSINNQQIKNTLNANDIAGGVAVMARNTSGAVCGNAVMVALTPSLCTLAAPTASFNIPASVCVGQVITLTDLSANSPISWQWTMTGGTPPSATTQNTNTSYSTPGVKTITLVATNGIGSNTITKTTTVIANPTVGVTSASICSGNNAVLTATGATSYTWIPGALTGASQTLSPGSTQIYTVSGTTSGCNGSSTGTINVTQTPTVSANSSVVCASQPATLTASGAANFTWNPGALTGATQSFTNGSTQVYTITGANGTCTGVGSATISITNTLGLGLSPSSNTICAGSSATLTGSGATNYTFNPGGVVTNPAVVTPSATTVYTVDGTTFGCTGNAVVTVTVVNCSVGLDQSNSNSVYRIYPNPTQGNLMIAFGNSFTGKVSVYNSLGQLLLNKNVNALETMPLNLTEYAKGIYLVKISTVDNDGTFIKVVRD